MADANPEATRMTGASGLRELVLALYTELHTWRRVATTCDGERENPRGSYYRSIATGGIKRPGAVTRRRIVAEYHKRCRNDVTGYYNALERTLRHNVSLKPALGASINQWRIERGMTWNEWHEKADALMRREYTSCDETHRPAPLS